MWSDKYVDLQQNEDSAEHSDLFGLKPVSMEINKGHLWWFGHAEHNDDAGWVKRCWMTMEVDGIRQMGCLTRTWWNGVKEDLENFGLSNNQSVS